MQEKKIMPINSVSCRYISLLFGVLFLTLAQVVVYMYILENNQNINQC
jgi:CHASE3 domain sensor protein